MANVLAAILHPQPFTILLVTTFIIVPSGSHILFLRIVHLLQCFNLVSATALIGGCRRFNLSLIKLPHPSNI